MILPLAVVNLKFPTLAAGSTAKLGGHTLRAQPLSTMIDSSLAPRLLTKFSSQSSEPTAKTHSSPTDPAPTNPAPDALACPAGWPAAASTALAPDLPCSSFRRLRQSALR